MEYNYRSYPSQPNKFRGNKEKVRHTVTRVLTTDYWLLFILHSAFIELRDYNSAFSKDATIFRLKC